MEKHSLISFRSCSFSLSLHRVFVFACKTHNSLEILWKNFTFVCEVFRENAKIFAREHKSTLIMISAILYVSITMSL